MKTHFRFLIRVLAYLDRSLAVEERSLSSWPVAGLLLLTLVSILTLTALGSHRDGVFLPRARGRTNILPTDVTDQGDVVPTDTSESCFLILSRMELSGSGCNPATSSSPLNTPPLAVEEAHVQ